MVKIGDRLSELRFDSWFLFGLFVSNYFVLGEIDR